MKAGHRSILLGVVQLVFNVCIYGLIMVGMIAHPASGLPPEWRPNAPLRVSQPVTPLTDFRLRKTVRDAELCRSALLAHKVEARALPPLLATDTCGIANRVSLSRLGLASLAPVDTSCATALRLAMWEAHSLQPNAQSLFGQDVVRIAHIGSYACRAIRSDRGSGTRPSSHSRAAAIDISGFTLADGQTLDLKRDWNESGPKGAYLRKVHREACRWFGLVLGPDYNRLHADHFHLQNTGWPICR